MYKETKETIVTVILTALIVGGGMYAYFNYTPNTEVKNLKDTETRKEVTEKTTKDAKNKTNENSESANELTISEASYTDEFTKYENGKVSFEHPRSWGAIYKGNSESPHWDTAIFKKADGKNMANLNCPIPEAGFGIGYNVFQKKLSEKNGQTSELKLLIRDEDEAPVRPGENTALAIVLMNSKSNNWQDTCMLIAHTKDSNPEAFFDLYERIFETLVITKTDEKVEKVFKPETFTNEGYGYSIDYPDNWYWVHRGDLGGVTIDAAGFASSPIPETPEYMGVIVIQILNRPQAEIMEEERQWLENLEVKAFTMKSGASAMSIYGTRPAGGMNMGSTNVMRKVIIPRNGKTFMVAAIGPTPEEEKIFDQMVESLWFEN